MEQRCENCKWWISIHDDPLIEICDYPLPAFVQVNRGDTLHKGKYCPCWQLDPCAVNALKRVEELEIIIAQLQAVKDNVDRVICGNRYRPNLDELAELANYRNIIDRIPPQNNVQEKNDD